MLCFQPNWSNYTTYTFVTLYQKGTDDADVTVRRAQASKSSIITWENLCFASTRPSGFKLINDRFMVVCYNRWTLLFCHRCEQIHNRGGPEQFPATRIESTAVKPECTTLFPDRHSGPNLRGSPRGQPQETDRPEVRPYVIMTSVCCPV